MFELEAPRSRDEVRAGLDRLAGELATFLEDLPAAEFLAPQGDAWSPDRHLRHLNTSVAAVLAGMRAPKIALALRFGRPRRLSRPFAEVVEAYRSALAAGGEASGRYLPCELPADADREAWRARTLERWRERSAALSEVVGRWSEKALDRHQAPHPLLGKMTMREILFFTLYHNAHHARRIYERRLPRTPSPEEA